MKPPREPDWVVDWLGIAAVVVALLFIIGCVYGVVPTP